MKIMIKPALLVFLLCLFVFGCATPPKSESPLVKLSPGAYPEFIDDLDYEGLEASIARSLEYLGRIPSTRTFTVGEDTYDAAHMVRSLERFRDFIATRPDPGVLKGFIRAHYRVYRSAGEEKTEQVLFTGYFEPLLQGNRSKTPAYPYPVYGPPEDLAVVDLSQFSSKFDGEKIIGRVDGKSFVPYYDRADIDRDQALIGKAPELAWVDNPVDLFFLHIQGSGKIAFPDGSTLNVHYHSKNGRPYRSIGQLLIEEDKVSRKEMSMQKIKSYLRNHPEEVDRVLYHNPSYIFFSVEEEGPLGALNVKLTPGRSMAVDRGVFPMTALSFIRAQKPVIDPERPGVILDWTPFSRFVLNQDTGGAIKGPGRADIFWGNGEYAEIAAGHLKHRGDLFVLVLRPDAA